MSPATSVAPRERRYPFERCFVGSVLIMVEERRRTEMLWLLLLLLVVGEEDGEVDFDLLGYCVRPSSIAVPSSPAPIIRMRWVERSAIVD